MKKLMMYLLLFGALPLQTMAQDDDMYFVPTKENQAKEAKSYGMPSATYYSGSSRSVDEYNRRAYSSVSPIDSAGNDIIDFSPVRGVYPDSTYQEETQDYAITRRMTRFDDYTPSQAYWDGYRDGRWASPWYYSSWYGWYDYDPWYWDSPWYYRGYYGWYSPWHYGYYRPWHYGYYRPYWYGGGITPRGLSGERPTPQADALVRLRLIAPLIPVAARSAAARPAILLRVAAERRSAVAVVAAADLVADVLPVADVALAGVGSVVYEYRKMLFNV